MMHLCIGISVCRPASTQSRMSFSAWVREPSSKQFGTPPEYNCRDLWRRLLPQLLLRR
ncbi:hypothetical protein LINGRAPRIM_LOCUS3051 [Linum grandiflorum]